MTKWRPNPRLIKRPAYLSIAEQIAGAVRDGLLIDGMRLPPQRQMAADLKISVQTVSRAYEELSRRGLVTGEVGRGSYIKASSSAPERPHLTEGTSGVVDLSILKPVCESRSLGRFRNAFAELGATMPPDLAFSMIPNALFRRYRMAGVSWLAACGLKAPPHGVTVTNGSSDAMTAAFMSVAPPGSAMAAEDLTHPMARPLAGYLGIDLESVPTDAEGILPSALEALAARKRLRAIFLQPSAAGPRGTVTSAPRRRAIAGIARRFDLAIIENDVLGPLVENRPPPLAAFAPERTLYMTDLSKNTIPGLRCGFLVAPDRYAAVVSNRYLAANWIATPVMAEIASRWIVDGTAMELVNWQRMALKRRRAIADKELSGIACAMTPGALHVWIPLPEGTNEAAFVDRARHRGVAVAAGSSFRAGREPTAPAIRVALAASSEIELSSSLALIAAMLQGESKPRRAARVAENG
ncbi:PLP-dependent aminotransferase family protein [Martelella lutilitoris]|uniref:PLP-dependent aminotransferase family protein n=1 Tax=Martelella lutilitoris TaxID=2583532 RepID=A0A5C4JY28_9HYPH|nr:PLP-dependent aminotransferase family protein [Martelella lutilitoris]TNB49509.1 PLP-dependent aminotransferase family protein [Martelella lutilitoris]